MIFKRIPFKYKFNTKLFIEGLKGNNAFNGIKLNPKQRTIYIFLAADYGNLGDVAITYAQTEFIKKYSDAQVVEIPISKSLKGLWFVKRNIKKNDIVTTVGGGNMGDIYDQIEHIRQVVINFFPDNKIISFPQTLDFSESKKGEKALKKAKKIYNGHNNLHLFAREETSYQKMKKNFESASVYKTPDIVLSLDKNSSTVRSSALVCMRNDVEKKITTQQTEILSNIIASKYNDITFYDTHIGKSQLTIDERLMELNKIWDAFKNSEIVFTDRLHGMIFCHITKTPAVVFQNNNHKVRETYEWIKENKNICLISDFNENDILQFINNLENNKNNIVLEDKYQPLYNLLK
ncbi:polysaccharide pyruvyl transferase family protein [Epilithonimonas arachidiradicis]|uniref:Pyruvyl transferase EpsI n=1 Tax=Epilithonimonas arachidiradicis TaxID=1617282 RepID=A0A420CJ20_9FLAO|nr:polysaccharide pyruvyl transferase family protein [Epilithonimonas arachidiradicis]RKE78374.1 pyruvyl transferase EpsI [Epilithonimonas arachidiradicis]GGG67218.1 putative pyruvyl transferase EpsI [Epilithonimonas arachidiradicis]